MGEQEECEAKEENMRGVKDFRNQSRRHDPSYEEEIN